MEKVDVSGDGGVMLRFRAPQNSSTLSPWEGSSVRIKYAVSMAEASETVVDAAESLSFTLGRGEVVPGVEVVVRRMRVGDNAEARVRFDYAYGEHGLPGRIPAHADLNFSIELLSVDETGQKIDSEPVLALPAPSQSTTSLTVGGASVKLEHLGPLVINTDGSTSRIENWVGMSAAEQEKTQRIIAKRNQKRLAEQRGVGGN